PGPVAGNGGDQHVRRSCSRRAGQHLRRRGGAQGREKVREEVGEMTERTRRKSWVRLVLALAVFAVVWLMGNALAAPQAAPAAAQRTSDQAFKNIQVMKGIPLDDFMGTMGIMCAALGFDCSDCHTGAG